MRPDSALVDVFIASPNHGDRHGGVDPTMLILHYTGMPPGEGALARLTDPASEVSCHYLVLEDGRLVQLVAESRRAWHAGRSFWAGKSDINSHSIGIEIANPGHDWGYVDFPEPQMQTVIGLARDIVSRREIRPDRVLGHSDVAPLRKEDPGERFEWRRLASAGVGLWAPPAAIVAGPVLAAGDGGPSVAALQRLLLRFGYGLEATGRYDEPTAAVVRAFQRHFRPARVDGVADVSTLATLRKMLRLKKKRAGQPR